MRINIFIFFWLLTSLIAAKEPEYTVYGYVKDKESGEYLPDAQIIIDSIGMVANRYGFYTVQLKPGPHFIECHYIGYSTFSQKIHVTGNFRLDILMKSGIMIQDVFVKGNKPENVLPELNHLGSISLRPATISGLPFFVGETDIMKGFQLLPGVSSGKEGSSDVNIRGGSSDETLVLLDEAPIYNQNHTFGLVSVFNDDALKTGTIYKGGIPARYGGRLSGVTLLTMKEGNLYKHKQTVSLSTVAGSIALEGPLKKGKASYLVTARRSLLDLLYSGVLMMANSSNVRPGFSFLDINGKMNVNLDERNHLFGGFYMGNDRFSFNFSSPDEKGNLSFGWGNKTSSIRWNSIFFKKMFSNITLYYSYLSNDQRNYYKTKDFISKDKISSQTGEYGLRISVDYDVSKTHHLKFGVNTSGQNFFPAAIKIKQDRTEIDKGEQLSLYGFSPFLEDNISFRGLSFIPGVRMAYFRNHSQHVVKKVEPRFRFQWNINEKNKLMAGYTEMNQPVFRLYNSYFHWPVDMWLPYYMSLKPAHARQISAGWEVTPFTGSELSIETYYKKMDNMILINQPLEDFVLNPEENQIIVTNGHAYGVEILYKFNHSRINGWLSYAYSRSLRSFKSDPEQTYFPYRFDKPHDVNIVLNINLSGDSLIARKFSIHLSYTSGNPYIVATNRIQGISPPLSPTGYFYDFTYLDYLPSTPNIRLNDYFRTDISYSSKKILQHGSRTWVFSILNITNHKNPYLIFRDQKGNMKQMTLFPVMPAIVYKRKF